MAPDRFITRALDQLDGAVPLDEVRRQLLVVVDAEAAATTALAFLKELLDELERVGGRRDRSMPGTPCSHGSTERTPLWPPSPAVW